MAMPPVRRRRTPRVEDEFLDDVTQIYLNEIGATRLLTRAGGAEPGTARS